MSQKRATFIVKEMTASCRYTVKIYSFKIATLMTKEQRIAICRVISDMIKADSIIEETEILGMKRLMSDYSLTRRDMEAARNIKFSDAIPALKELPLKERQEFVKKIYGIAQSDNVCVPREALLLIALRYCLLDENKWDAPGKRLPKPYLVSCATGEATLNDQYMVYVESSFDQEMNNQLERNFRLLVTLSRLSGFNFIYIPKMAQEFKNMRKDYVLDVISYMAPHLDNTLIRDVYDRLCKMTTVQFFRNVLYERLQVHTPYNIAPSLLLNIGTSVVPYCSAAGPVQYYTEFLCIPITADILSMVEDLLGYYQSHASVRQTISYGGTNGQFKYFGFYKALFDFLVAPPPVAPDLIFLGQNMKTGRYQVSFRFGTGYEKCIDLTPKEYVTYFDIAQKSYLPRPGLSVNSDRGIKSVVSHIKNKISAGVPDLTFADRYKPESHGNAYTIRLDRSKVFVRQYTLECASGCNDIAISNYKK